MKKVIFKSIVFFLLLLPLNCGFKVVDKSKLNKFSIKEISISGDKRINFKIKNNLIIDTGKKNEKLLLIDLNTRKIKTIKEKNIKNEITKYQISLNVEIKFNLIDSVKEYQSSLAVSGDYLVADSYSTTLTNEKRLIGYLIEDISEKILNNINSKLNDI
tara:strand:- start:1248 stop:1724 length:477 start_codon:yes stop_codon:yes gene_type:complete